MLQWWNGEEDHRAQRSRWPRSRKEHKGLRGLSAVTSPHLIHNILQRRDRRDARQVLAGGPNGPVAPLSFPPYQSAFYASRGCTAIVAAISKSRRQASTSAHALSSSPTIKTPSPGASSHDLHADKKIPGSGLASSTSHDSVGGYDSLSRIPRDCIVFTIVSRVHCWRRTYSRICI